LGNLIAGVSNYNLDLKKKKALKLHLLLQLFFYCLLLLSLFEALNLELSFRIPWSEFWEEVVV